MQEVACSPSRACAGLRAWLPLLLASLLARAGWLDLGPSFQFLASNKALLLFAVATVVVGLLAAIFPARRASKLNVLEALQYE